MKSGTVVVGGGSCGAVAAARLAEAGEDVVLVEAGPDYGAADSGRWPTELLDPALMPLESHSWGYSSASRWATPGMDLQRARVIGGCSTHNGCAVVWGDRHDYDDWDAIGNPGWGADEVAPFLEMANRKMEVMQPSDEEITPLHQSVLLAAEKTGYGRIPDLLDLDVESGVGVGPVNIHQQLRWNASFAYIDPVRDLPGLTILDSTLVDRLLLEGGRVNGVVALRNGEQLEIEADQVVLAGGSYGTPLILQRSGIGQWGDLTAAGIEPIFDLPGVGHHLMDHPAIQLRYEGSEALTTGLDAFVNEGGMPREEGTIFLTRSTRCAGRYDLHLYPIAHRRAEGEWDISISAAVMASRSTGVVRATSVDPHAKPHIDHGYLTDDEGYDLDALVDAVSQIRKLASNEPLSSLLGPEIAPGPPCVDHDAVREFIQIQGGHDYHPTSTCRMGPADDPGACVDTQGILRGFSNVIVADASIMPRVTVANTNLPAIAVAEKIVEGLI